MLKGKVLKKYDRTIVGKYDDEIEVEVRHVTQAQMRDLRGKATITRWDSKTHDRIEEFDNEKFYELYAKEAIVNWHGITGEKLRTMVPMREEDYLLGDIPFSPEDGAQIMLGCKGFEKFVSMLALELEAHEEIRKAVEVKNSAPSPADS